MSSKSNSPTSGARTASPLQDPPRSPELIRNVAVVGHAGAGKTTLTEALLAVSGTIERAGSVSAGTTVSDCDPIEIAVHHSVGLSVCPLRWNDVTVNLLDTPGSLDFAGELRAGLRAGDAAIFMVSAADGIDPVAVALWEECAAAGTPRGIVVDRHETSPAAFGAAIAQAQQIFGSDGSDVLPLYVLNDSGDGLIGLLTGEVPQSAEAARGVLIEAIINNSEDETLLDRYLAGEVLDPDVLRLDLAAAVRRGHFFPVIPIDTNTGLGLTELLDGILAGFPSPVQRQLPPTTLPDGSPSPALTCDPNGPLLAEVVRTTVDPYLGRLSVLRIFCGTITPETSLHVSSHLDNHGGSHGGSHGGGDERVTALHSPLGATLRPITAAIAGDICAISRLSAETGDTLSAKTEPLVITPWPTPEALLPIAVRPPTRNDEDALAKALTRLSASDPAVRIERRGSSGQLVLWCLGEAHADVVLERLRTFGATVETQPVEVELLETFRTEATGHGRQVKQSGGHGQYAVCDVIVTPLPRGSSVEFAEKVVGGAVPSQFIGSVEKGVRAALAAGLDDRKVPVTDVRVTLVDGKAHSVDSSDAAFQTAGALAVRDAAANAGLALLEPLDMIEVTVPDAYVGAVMSHLSGHRGRVSGATTDTTAPPGMERTVISAEVPQAELVRFPITLRGLTAGSGRFTRRFSRYDVMPQGS